MNYFEVSQDIAQVRTYHNEESAFFHVFETDLISIHLKNAYIWEPQLQRVFEEHITKDMVVLEGGCHIGSHSVKLSKLAKSVICFEPFLPSYDLLLKNIELNNCTNVTVYDKGLSDSPSQSEFAWINVHNVGGSGLINNPMGVPIGFSTPESLSDSGVDFKVDLVTIDSLNLDQLDFIKLDVEGYEPNAILGGIETITKFKPKIVVECWANHQGGLDTEYTKNQFSSLIDLGYSVAQIFPGSPDWLFIHKG
jgi:FkbM family methyltransferase